MPDEYEDVDLSELKPAYGHPYLIVADLDQIRGKCFRCGSEWTGLERIHLPDCPEVDHG